MKQVLVGIVVALVTRALELAVVALRTAANGLDLLGDAVLSMVEGDAR